MYLDGVYLARPAMALTNFLDLERVEVLRGPQGTLYGHSATAGVVAVHTRNPDLGGFGGDAAVEWGDYGLQHYTGAVNIPIDQLPQSLAQISKDKPVAVYCASGARSLNAKQFLAAQGYKTVLNLQQGIASWTGATVQGSEPGSAGSAGSGGQPGGASSAGKTVTIKTAGKPVFVDLYTDY